MPSKTEKQKKFFGAVMGAKKGQKGVSGEAKKVAKKMPKKEIEKFLKTEKEEDEQSVTKKMKQGGGKAVFEGPKVKERKHFAPTTQKHKDKTKYVRDKKPPEEDAEFKKGETSEVKKADLKRMREENKGKKLSPPEQAKLKGGLQKTLKKELNESASIIKFIEAIMTEDHAKAHRYLKDTINQKIQERISQEIEKPLF